MTTLSFDADRPRGSLAPPSDSLEEFAQLVEQDDCEAALNAIEAHDPKSSYHADWGHYLRGLAFFGLEYFEAGYNAFEIPYERTTEILPERELGARIRLAAKCLQKMGWLHRRNEKFQRAYALHSIQFQYLSTYGSPEEIHEATISLDVDSYFLKNAYLSKMWLETSLRAAEAIDPPETRYRSLGLSWNNLAGTLCQLQQFDAAEDAIDSSLEAWSEYESLAGTEEHRCVWARYGVGDVYDRWAEHLTGHDDDAARKKFERARDVLSQAIDLAEDQGMQRDEREPIVSKLHRIESKLDTNASEGG